MTEGQGYVGEELDLFAHAYKWKTYFGQRLRPFLRGKVLEVGAGIGGTSRILWRCGYSSWTCLEPDTGLAQRLAQTVQALPGAQSIYVKVGTIGDLAVDEQFHTILYIDVLEHIADESQELRLAAQHVRQGGRLIVLAPAHGFLFSPFDDAIGHHRRYTCASLAALAPPGLVIERQFYLDSVGLLASLGNRFLLKAAMPTARQIRIWDRFMVPCSRWLDPLLGYRLGKSVVSIWRKRPGALWKKDHDPLRSESMRAGGSCEKHPGIYTAH